MRWYSNYNDDIYDGNMMHKWKRKWNERRISCKFLFSFRALNYYFFNCDINNSAYKWFKSWISIDFVPVFNAMNYTYFRNHFLEFCGMYYMRYIVFTFYLTIICE